MSTSLAARVKSLRERLLILDRLGANVEETGLLVDLRSELEPTAVELRNVIDQRNMLVDAGIEADAPASLGVARKRAVSLLEKFEAEKKASILKKGVGWSKLIQEIEAASADLKASIIKSWKAYRQTVFTGDAPSVIKGRLAFTPANTSAFTQYDQLHQSFRAEFERVPADKAGIERVRKFSATLTEIAKTFDFDVPGEVKRFLEAIQSGGATLDLLTGTVKDWLKANDAFESYRILPRSADGRQ